MAMLISGKCPVGIPARTEAVLTEVSRGLPSVTPGLGNTAF